MPGVPAPTIAEAAHTYSPIDTLILRTNEHLSILDTIFVSKLSRRAVYATTTRGPHTSFWRVVASGTMTEIARVDWEYEVRIASAGDGSLRNSNQPIKRCPMLTFNGRMVRTEDFLPKGRGWFSSDSSRTFSANNTEYKWKSGTENTGLRDGQHVGHRNMPYPEAVKIWRCVLARPDSSNSSPKAAPYTPSLPPYFSASPMAGIGDSMSLATAAVDPPTVTGTSYLTSPSPSRLLNSSASPVTRDRDQEAWLPSSSPPTGISPILSAPAPPTLLARFAPPQPGLMHNEISLFPPAIDFSSDVGKNPRLLEYLLVSAVILGATKGEWKQVQSSVDASSLQAIFVAEAAGDVPPYTPGGRRTNTVPPVTARNRSYLGRSRSCDHEVREEAQHSMDHLVEDLDRVPLLPRRGAHQTSRSSPFRPFHTSQSEIRPNTGRANCVYPSDPEHRTQRLVVPRRPATADSTQAGDGVFTRRRPSLHVVNAAQTPTWAPRRRPSTAGGMHSRSTGSPPPVYR